jgi:hypothetical protein
MTKTLNSYSFSAIFLFFNLLSAITACGQDGAMKGIDAYYSEDGYYDNLDDALQNAEAALYLDLSLQSPKLTSIPDGVFKLPHLNYLELGFNQIGAVDDRISKLTELEVLGLEGNKYLKNVSSEISVLVALKELHLFDTGLSSEQVQTIKKLIPDSCKLKY